MLQCSDYNVGSASLPKGRSDDARISRLMPQRSHHARTARSALLALCLCAPVTGWSQTAPVPARSPTPTAPSVASPPASASSPSAGSRGSGISDIGYLSAKQLSDRCSSAEPSSSSYCFAYLAAVTDSARAYEIWLSSREFCLPAGIAQSEVRRAFMTYVSAYPAQASGQAASVVINALKQTYPCD